MSRRELFKQFKRLDKKEQRILKKKENKIIKSTVDPIKGKIQDKIPDRVRVTLENTFSKSFQLVFEKGDVYIEKTYKKDKKKLEHDLINYGIDRDFSKKGIRKLDKQANKTKNLNTSFTFLEGGILGFLGIGLPDIPFFIAVIMRTIFEVALSYGYDYKSDEEKSYILLIICGTMSQGEEKRQYNEKIDHLGYIIDKNMETKIDLKEQMEETSKVLANSILVGKFVQGIPIVGAVGGVVNYTIIKKIGKFASIKYKKRYMLEKERIY